MPASFTTHILSTGKVGLTAYIKASVCTYSKCQSYLKEVKCSVQKTSVYNNVRLCLLQTCCRKYLPHQLTDRFSEMPQFYCLAWACFVKLNVTVSSPYLFIGANCHTLPSYLPTKANCQVLPSCTLTPVGNVRPSSSAGIT